MGPLIWLLGRAYSASPGFLRRAAVSVLSEVLRAAGIRRAVIRENLARAYPDEAQGRERRNLEREAYRHLARLTFEILMLPSFGALKGALPEFVRKESRLIGLENWQRAKSAGKGVLFLSSHVGNWEVMAATGAIHGGMDLMIVTKRLKPDWLHAAIERGRAACGVSATYEPRTLKDVLRHLHAGETVGFVLDQYAGPPVGVRVPVFGTPVGTTTAVAMLAKRTGASVLPVVNYRSADGSFCVEIREPLEWDALKAETTEALARNTARYAAEMERDIRNHPGQWLWIHRRFKGDLSPLRPGEWSEGRTRA